MAIRFQSEFTSDNGDSYKIEIHDSEWLGGTYTFNVDSRGFQLEYTGETDDIVSPIIGSKLCVGAYSNDGQFETFITSLKGYQENRFRIVVYRETTQDGVDDFVARVLADGGSVEATGCVRDAVVELLQGERYFDNSPIQVATGQFTARVLADGGTIESPSCLTADVTELLGLTSGIVYRLFWAGWIVQDLVTIEDASQPYIYEITATDGLNRLNGIDYDSANDITQNDFGLTRVTDVIINVLTDTGLTDLWTSTDPFLETSVDWWEYNQTYSTTDDTLYLTAIDAGLFTSRDDDGNIVRTSAFEVLRQLATLYNSRLFLSNGRFVFEQIGNRATATRYAVQYDTTGVELATLTIADDIPLNQTLFGARLAGNVWNFLPALKKVSLTYAQRFLSPWFGAFKYTATNTTFDAGFISGGSDVQLALYGPFTYTITSSTGSGTNDIFALAAVYRAQIRISDSSNPGTYYYFNRAFNGYLSAQTFGTAAWSTSAGYYYFDNTAQSVGAGSAILYDITTITTPDIPVTGSLRVVIELYNKYNVQSGAAYTLAAHQTESWNAVVAFSRVDDGQEPASGVVYSANNSSALVSSNLSLDLGEIAIADGATQTGDLVVWNGSSWVAASQWAKGSTSGGIPILKLLTSETLALHALPIQRYDSAVLTSGLFEQRLTFDGIAYLRMNGTFTANIDEWSGTLFAIQRTRTNISTADPIPVDRTPAGGRNAGGLLTGGKNELNAGKVAGMTLDVTNEKMGPFQQVATGGKVNGTFQSTGAATMSSTLTIVGDTDFEGSHTASIEDVTHNDGSEYEVQNTDFIVFNKWDGGNGQAFINLPAVSSSEGRMIRFKSDGTIGANTYVTLRPDSGDTGVTIDGESSVDFNRSYDGIMVLCHNNQWFIVQRKSK